MINLRNSVVCLALIGLTAFGFYMFKQEQEVVRPFPSSYPSVNPYVNSIAASGIVEAYGENLSVGAPTSGIVIDVLPKVWEYVKKGDPLFQIDPCELKEELEVQKAHLEVAMASLKRAHDQWIRLKEAQSEDRRMVGEDEVRTSENDMLVADAQVKCVAAQLKQKEIMLGRLLVKAPKDGIILQSNVRVGEFLVHNAPLPAMVLGDITRLQIRADVDEQNAWQLLESQDAVAYPKNNTLLSIPLHFERIEPYIIPKKSLTGSSEERVDTRVLQVIFSFTPPVDFPIYVGQQVDIFIKVRKK